MQSLSVTSSLAAAHNVARLVCRNLTASRSHFGVAVSRNVSSIDASSLEAEIDEANERCRGEVEIRLTDDHRGWGVFALRDYSPTERVIVGRALRLELEQGTHTIQTDWETHVFMDLPGRYINHVCGIANLGSVDNAHGAYDFQALRDIKAGEELRWDYECSEYIIPSFECTCGSPLCRRRLKGYRSNGARVRALYGDKYIANYLKSNR